MILSALSLLLLCTVRTSLASDARAFYNYLKEVAEPDQSSHAAGREGRQSIPLSIFSLNGFANFTYSVSGIPTNYPIACGGDDRNYCNYPDLPLIETYDLNYYSRRPIPSGRCPDGYTKSPTFDCLNIAPALFETTCCVYLGSTTPSVTDICSGTIDAAWTLCNGTLAIASGAYVWYYNVGTSSLTLRAGPMALSAISGGCVTRDLSEATVDGNCDVVFFNLNDQYYTTSYRTGSSATCSGPFLNTNIGVGGTPSQAFRVGGSTTIYHLDGDGFTVGLPSGFLFNCGGNTSSGISVTPPGVIGSSPYVNCSAVTYVGSQDILWYFCGTAIYRITRAGVVQSTLTLGSVLSNCAGGTTTVTGSTAAVAPVVYIPYPIYPVFMGSGGSAPGGSTPGGSSYTPGSSSYSSGSYSPSPSPSPTPSPSPSPSPSSYGSMSPSASYGK